MKIQVYTAITGGFDPDRDDITCFRSYDRFVSSRMNAKIYKIMPHLFFPDAEITIWLDGNIRFAPGINIEQFVDDFLGPYDMALFNHPWRDCAYQEAMICINDGLDGKHIILSQVSQYMSDGFPKYWGLWECGVIVRRHNPKTKFYNEQWWAQICRFSSRDQISLPYIHWKTQNQVYKASIVGHTGNVREDSRFIYTKRQSSKP